MSTISLPEFMDRTSLQKPPSRTTTFIPQRAGSVKVSAGSIRQPRYRIQFASSEHRSVQSLAVSRYSKRICRADTHHGLPHRRCSAPSKIKNAVLPLERQSRPQFHRTAQKPASNSRLRLTRRGRLVFRGLPVLTLVALVALGALTFIFPAQAKSSSNQLSAPVSQMVTVYHGDSLWTIAQQLAPEQDSRDVVDRIMRINNLTSAQVRPGQVLEVPIYSE